MGEHYLDTVGVGGSIPPVPTKTEEVQEKTAPAKSGQRIWICSFRHERHPVAVRPRKMDASVFLCLPDSVQKPSESRVRGSAARTGKDRVKLPAGFHWEGVDSWCEKRCNYRQSQRR